MRASSSSPQIATIPVQAVPAWYKWHWDHEYDPWNGAVVVINKEDGHVEEELSGERETAKERRGKT